MQSQPQISNELLYLMNQLFELDKKAAKISEPHTMSRNLDRMKRKFADLGLEITDPLGERYDETRTDCEANIAGTSTENLVITEVIKPIIRMRAGGAAIIVQKGVVIVESK